MWKAHPYEQVAYEVIPIQNKNPEIGSGMWGTLKKDISEVDFLTSLKRLQSAYNSPYCLSRKTHS